ncbi:MAG: hypothetical protein IPJ36_17875 [Simplicispira sp.]|nr:hypothetical protein [Simplicispira sp.]
MRKLKISEKWPLILQWRRATQLRVKWSRLKIELSKDNPEYAAVLQNKALQSSIKTAEDAIYQPALQSVMYMLKIVSPVTSLMENPDEG